MPVPLRTHSRPGRARGRPQSGRDLVPHRTSVQPVSGFSWPALRPAHGCAAPCGAGGEKMPSMAARSLRCAASTP